MNRDMHITAEGNVVRDPEYLMSDKSNGYTRNAIAVERRFKQGDDWVSDTTFLDFTILDERLAENFCDSVSKGDRIIIAGDLRQRTVEDDEGNKRTFYGLVVDNAGISLKWATATVIRNEKKGGSTQSSGDSFFD